MLDPGIQSPRKQNSVLSTCFYFSAGDRNQANAIGAKTEAGNSKVLQRILKLGSPIIFL